LVTNTLLIRKLLKLNVKGIWSKWSDKLFKCSRTWPRCVVHFSKTMNILAFRYPEIQNVFVLILVLFFVVFFLLPWSPNYVLAFSRLEQTKSSPRMNRICFMPLHCSCWTFPVVVFNDVNHLYLLSLILPPVTYSR
jgi:hypothetical protein